MEPSAKGEVELLRLLLEASDQLGLAGERRLLGGYRGPISLGIARRHGELRLLLRLERPQLRLFLRQRRPSRVQLRLLRGELARPLLGLPRQVAEDGAAISEGGLANLELLASDADFVGQGAVRVAQRQHVAQLARRVGE